MGYSKTHYTVFLYKEQGYGGSHLEVEKMNFEKYEDAINYRMKAYHTLKEVQAIFESQKTPTKKEPDPPIEISRSIIQRISGRTPAYTRSNEKYELNFADGNNGYFRLYFDKEEMLKAIVCLRSLNLGLSWDFKSKVVWNTNSTRMNKIEEILEKNKLCKKRF